MSVFISWRIKNCLAGWLLQKVAESVPGIIILLLLFPII